MYTDLYVFHKSNIESLSKHRGLLSVGLRIHHTVPLYPELIVFCGFSNSPDWRTL